MTGHLKRSGLAGVAALFFLFGISSGQQNYNTWSYHMPIYLNTSASGANVPGNVYNFPVLVRLNPSNFTAGFPLAAAGGADIRFSKTNYADTLPYQIERWNTTIDSAEIWVLLDTVFGNSTGQSIVMHYGNATVTTSSSGPSVFQPSNGFWGVWHLAEAEKAGRTPGPYYMDATGQHPGDDSVSATGTQGIIGQGHNFGSNDCIMIGNADPNPNQLTISMWVNWTTMPSQWQNMVTKRNTWGTATMRWQTNFATECSNIALYDGSSQHCFGNTFPSLSTWHHLAFVTVNGDSTVLYIDGVEAPTVDQSSWGTLTTAALRLGNDDANEYYRGYLDEPRIDTVVRSSNWIMLCFQNQQTNQTLLSTTMLPPSLSSPANGAGGLSLPLTLSWYAVAGASTYEVQVATISAFSTTIMDVAGLSTVSAPASGLTTNAQYYWRANASASGTTTGWSGIWKFNTIPLPAAPVLSSPTNNAANEPGALTLSWGTVATASSYGVQVSVASNFSTTLFGQSGLTTPNAAISGLSNVTTYYWKANAVNGGGMGPWSAVWSFSTMPNPSVPVLLTPANGAKILPTNIVLSWGTVAAAAYYKLQMALSADFSDVFYTDSLAKTSDTLATIATGITYYWQVAASNGGSPGPWSNGWSFTTAATGIIPSEASAKGLLTDFVVKGDAIAYSLATSGEMEITFSDMLGRTALDFKKTMSAGNYSMAIKTFNLASGNYLVRFRAEGVEKRAIVTVTR